MAIYKVAGGVYVISSRQCWLPGVFADERAARLAFRLSDKALGKLSRAFQSRYPDGAPDDAGITYDEVHAAWTSERKAGAAP